MSHKILFLGNVLVKEEFQKEIIDRFLLNQYDWRFMIVPCGIPRTTNATIKDFYDNSLKRYIENEKIEYIVCMVSDYFRYMCKEPKPARSYGYRYEVNGVNWFYCPSYRTIFSNPDRVRENIKIAINALTTSIKCKYETPGSNIFKEVFYPQTDEEVKYALDKIIELDTPVAIDIETFSLKHWNSGLASIAIAIDKNRGIAFQIDKDQNCKNTNRRNLLRDFFCRITKPQIYHNITFDVYILIYQLFMENLNDYHNMRKGLKILLSNFEDTKLITYLATNSCAGNDLKLKSLAQEYAGNWAVEEIKNIDKLSSKELLQYNLVDALSTWYVFEKYYPKMIKDNQFDFYNTIFKPAVLDIIEMQLVGLPVDKQEAELAYNKLNQIVEEQEKIISDNQYVKEYEVLKNEAWVINKNKQYKKKRVTIEDAHEKFNPNSQTQIRELLYNYIKLPILSFTDSGLPSANAGTLQDLVSIHRESLDENALNLINALLERNEANKILNTFIPPLLESPEDTNGTKRLFGKFNLGGTVSGRLSSSDPNLQNLPATGTKYAKLFKSCIKSTDEWLFVGLDFASLEDRISALTTRDPNKLSVYTEGYDSHAIRAYAYFPELMPDITEALEKHPENRVEIINSIKSLHKEVRQKSKSPTFALT